MFLTADDYLKSVEGLLDDSKSIDIAVAFWGQGAELLIPQTGKKLRILCNLAMGGTNPKVIKDLQAYPSVEIKALNRLHAKVMIGDQQAIIGSANCSANGLNYEGDELKGWYEAGFRTADQEQLTQMRMWFDERWAEGESITDQMISDATQTWEMRSKGRVVDTSSSRHLLKMSQETIARRDAVVLIWRTHIEEEAEQRFKEIRESVGNTQISSSWGAYEDWFDELHPGCTVLDIHIDEAGKVKVHGFVEIIDEARYTRVSNNEEMSLHICRPLKGFMGIPKSELLKSVNTQLKKHWRDLFADESGDPSQVIPLSEFVTKLRTV